MQMDKIIIYGAISYNSEYDEWINLVIYENGTPVSCNTFKTRKECIYDLKEGSKIKMNNRLNKWFEEYGIPVANYEIIFVEKTDTRFIKAKELNEKRKTTKNILFVDTKEVLDKIIFCYYYIKTKLIDKIL